MDKSANKDLYDLVNDFEVAMLVTHNASALHARPMAIARLDVDSSTNYLITDIDSVNGELAIVQDRELIESMWNEIWKVWFPLCKTDPSMPY